MTRYTLGWHKFILTAGFGQAALAALIQLVVVLLFLDASPVVVLLVAALVVMQMAAVVIIWHRATSRFGVYLDGDVLRVVLLFGKPRLIKLADISSFACEPDPEHSRLRKVICVLTTGERVELAPLTADRKEWSKAEFITQELNSFLR